LTLPKGTTYGLLFFPFHAGIVDAIIYAPSVLGTLPGPPDLWNFPVFSMASSPINFLDAIFLFSRAGPYPVILGASPDSLVIGFIPPAVSGRLVPSQARQGRVPVTSRSWLRLLEAELAPSAVHRFGASPPERRAILAHLSCLRYRSTVSPSPRLSFCAPLFGWHCQPALPSRMRHFRASISVA